MALIVQKYGGSSVADTESIKRVAKRVVETEKKGNKVAVVVSAMGDTTDDLIDQALSIDSNPPEREMDVTMEVIRKQIKIALQNVAVEDIKKVVIAYEPIWAIGTGKTATAEQANEVCSAIRDCLREKYGARAARGITIQYGGSMNAKNASELLAQPDVDGGLIGGASLKSADFATIVEAANQ